MAVTAATLFEAQYCPSTQTRMYESIGVRTIIDKFTATNSSVSPATISVNLVAAIDSTGYQNLMTVARALQPGEVYTFPEIVGHVLDEGDKMSMVSNTASAIVIRASGRKVT